MGCLFLMSFAGYRYDVQYRTLLRLNAKEQVEKAKLQAFENAINNSLNAVIIATAEKKAMIISWSKGAENLFGWKAHEVIGKSVEILIPANMLERHRKAYEKIIAKGRLTKSVEAQVVVCKGLNKHGKEIPIVVNLHKLSRGVNEETLPSFIIFIFPQDKINIRL